MVKRSFYRKKMRQKSRFAGTEEQPKPKLVGFYTDKEIDKVRPITKTSGKRVKKQIQVKQPRERRPASFKQPKKSKFELKEMTTRK